LIPYKPESPAKSEAMRENAGQEIKWSLVRGAGHTSQHDRRKVKNQEDSQTMGHVQRLAGKRFLVTGADTGIGREIALEFARQGADVVLHYCHHRDGALSAVNEIIAMGRRASAVGADFNHLEDVFSLADQAIQAFGAINCLVNNAGITFNKPFLKVAPQQFDALFNVNFRAQYFLTQRIAAHMIEGDGGSVCNLTSIHGLQGAPEHSAYAATKGAIIAFTRSLAVELAYRGVRVNAIAPGWITVENYFNAIPGFNEERARQDAATSVPVARYGLPVDVALLAAFLCSDESTFLVGQTITLDGGTTALMSLISNFREASHARFGSCYLPPSEDDTP
jgi:NAD(P)-dependent dehydrogenase (short-subunit alcohol dehydrogenase family)